MQKTEGYLTAKQEEVNRLLDEILPPTGHRPAVLHAAMRHAVCGGGKRLRPTLCLAVAETLGADPATALQPAVALELMHSSTLVHDDLPCMDDDALRRGKPSCHVQFGEANALLAGDALMVLSFEVLASALVPEPARLVCELAQAIGSRGVIGGQVEDLAAENTTPDPGTLDFIQLNKTARLIECAVRLGALCAGAGARELEALSRFGLSLGLAFQAVDDLLNATATADELGKPAGSDQARRKMTCVSVLGMEEARKRAAKLTAQALEALDTLPNHDTGLLCDLAKLMLNRQH